MHPKSKEELHQLLELISIEKNEDLKLYNDFINKTNLQQRKYAGICWQPLRLIETGYGMGDYPFLVVERTKQKGTTHQFSGGKQVSVFVHQDGKELESVNGTVHFVQGDQMKIILNTDDIPYWVQNSSIAVNLLFDEKSYVEMENTIKELLKIENGILADLVDIIYGNKEALGKKKLFEFEVPLLNDSQNEAVQSVLSTQDISIVHGPPGTGKTTTLVEAISQLSKVESTILVTAPSNAASDLLTEKLAERGLDVVRVGNLSRIDESVLEHTLEEMIGAHSRAKEIQKYKRQAREYRDMASKYKRNFGREEREQRKALLKEAKALMKDSSEVENFIIDDILDKADVIVSTLVGSNSRYLKDRRFKTVVIDEAAQGLEAACWIPIMKAEKVVLAGDPHQLPPTVKSQEAKKKGYEVTLIEKCIQRIDEVNLLNVQYRMNEHIMRFSNKQFYANQLSAHESVKDHILEGVRDDRPIEFIDTAGCSFDEILNEESRSYHNEGERDILKKHIEALLQETNVSSIGVISPYKQQVIRLKEELGDEFLASYPVTVNTIDSFQGQERDVIYISMVRSNENAQIGFLSDLRRMNVAMTRAKKKLVIIGDSATLGSTKFYEDFLNYCEQGGFYRTAWELM